MPTTVNVAKHPIGKGHPVYIIAEIGGNFTDLDAGRKLVDLALKAGADAVKLQHYRADTITSKQAMFEMENTGLVPQHTLFRKYELSEELTRQMVDYCRQKKITVFTTPSHRTDIEALRKFDFPAWKIGSDDATNIPFLKFVAKEMKPIILSTGMCTLDEVKRSVEAVRGEGNDQLILLHCVTNYPTHPESVNLRAMQTMQARFDLPVGYSDHTLDTDACYAAAVLGAAVLEFHFTHDRKAEGPDHMLSKNYSETAELVRKVRLLPTLLGDGVKHPAKSEATSLRNNRKSIVVARDIRVGEAITEQNIDIKRPGYGIPCDRYYEILGRVARRELKADDVLSWDDLKTD